MIFRNIIKLLYHVIRIHFITIDVKNIYWPLQIDTTDGFVVLFTYNYSNTHNNNIILRVYYLLMNVRFIALFNQYA